MLGNTGCIEISAKGLFALLARLDLVWHLATPTYLIARSNKIT